MLRNDEKMLRAYYREIRDWLPCSFGEKNRMINKIRTSVRDYLEDQPKADFAQIRAHFGEPRGIAAACVDEMDTVALLKALRIRRRITAMVAGTALLLMLVWGIGVGLCAWDSHQNAQWTVAERILFDEAIYLNEEGAR